MKIVITGSGIVSAIGINKQETLLSLMKEQSGVKEMHYLPSKHREIPVGEVNDSNAELCERIGISTQEVISRTSLLGIIAAKEAIEEAGIKDCSNMAFLSGTTVGGMDTTEQHFLEWQDNKQLDYISLHDAGSASQKITEHIGKFSYITTPSTACSSALNAIICGANLIKSGRYSQVLAGGAESLSCFHLNGFNTLMILDHECCRPFDATRAGLNLGEGAAYIVIESEESAINRGAKILGYISGYGNACDAYHQTASSENGEGAYLAMRKAMEMANLLPENIDYINAHGTGTPNNDASESAAMKRIFADKLPAISSTKSYTGHTTSASGSIETVICLLAMQNNFIPANLNWKNADENTIVPITKTTSRALNNVICNSFGFGGNDSSLILSKKADEIHICQPKCRIREAANIEITEDVNYKSYISPLEARRLTKQIRTTLVAAKMALETSQISEVDAIITGTKWGCIHNSVVFLKDMLANGEEMLKPTLFMQSTHNTMSSLVAIQTKCHGYNNTYSNGNQSFNDALLDAKTQLELGAIHSALVIGFDEIDEDWQQLLLKQNQKSNNIAKAIVLCSD